MAAFNLRPGICLFANGSITSYIDALNHTSTFVYDAVNQRIAGVDALGDRSTAVYDAVGNLVNALDALGNKTTFVYDADNRRTAVIDALGDRSTAVYDAVGNVVNTIDALGNKSTFVYDAANQRTAAIDALGNTTTAVFDAAGNAIARINERGYATTVTYDSLNRAIAQTDALGNVTSTVYDAAGNISASIDALGNAVTFTYDALDRQVTMKKPSGGVWTTAYDAVGNTVNTIDPLGHKATFVYDALDRRTASIDPLSGTTTSVYDAVGNRTVLVDPDGNRTTWAYDALHRVTTETDPLGHAATFAYDALSRQVSTTDRLGQRRDFTFDAIGEETRQKWYNASAALVNTQTFTYDAAGNPLTAADQNGAYTYTFDALNRVATVAEPYGLSLTFGYDAVGNRTSVQDSQGGLQTSTYDGDNNLTTRLFTGNSATLSYDYTYTARNQVATISYFSDLTGTTKIGETDNTYDSTGRQTNQLFKDGTNTAYRSVTYSYDNADRLTVKNDNGTLQTYTYDTTNQLTADSTNTYTYDANGSRNNGSYTVGVDNEITNDGTWTYTYDANGNLIEQSQGASATTWYFHYDVANRLVEADKYTAPGGALQERIAYTYDVYGNLIARTQYDGSLTVVAAARYGYDGWKTNLDSQGNAPTFVGQENWDVWADLDTGNSLVTRRLFGNSVNDLAARVSAAGVVGWYATDRQGSVLGMLDGSGTVQATMTYDGFGNQSSNSNPTYTDVYAFQGMRFEADDNTYDDAARWLNMSYDRFMSPDPEGFGAGDANLYRPVFNSQTNLTDPNGLDAWDWMKKNWNEFDKSFQGMFEEGGKRYNELSPETRKFIESVDVMPRRDQGGWLPPNPRDPNLQEELDQQKRHENTQKQRLLLPDGKINIQPGGWKEGVNRLIEGDVPGGVIRLAPKQLLEDVWDANQDIRQGNWGRGVPKLGRGLLRQFPEGRVFIEGVESLDGIAKNPSDPKAWLRTGEAILDGSDLAGLTPDDLSKLRKLGRALREKDKGRAILQLVPDLIDDGKTPCEALNPLQSDLRRGLQAIKGAQAIGKVRDALKNEDLDAIIGQIQGLDAIAKKLFGPCFEAGTPILVEGGSKAIEQLRPNVDYVLSRSEFEPDGPLEYKLVEELFVRSAPILNLHVAGRIIGTTAEHPFWVVGRGWTPAAMLRKEDVLVGHDGEEVRVDGVALSGRCVTVYNVRVQHHHTYFVGCQEWGFSVWVHNECAKTADELYEKHRETLKIPNKAIAGRAFPFYEATSKDAKMPVIGRAPDVAPHHGKSLTLDVPNDDWKPYKNSAWMQGGIDAGKRFKLVSDPNDPNNRLNPVTRIPPEYGHELKQLDAAGYTYEWDPIKKVGYANPPAK